MGGLLPGSATLGAAPGTGNPVSALAPSTGAAAVKGRRPLGDPGEEFRHVGMRAQFFDGVQFARQLGLGEPGMDLAVTDLRP